MGQGFTMSRKRKQTKAATIQGKLLGSRRQVVQTPTNSSHTALFGSGSSSVIKDPVAHTPTKNPIPVRKNKPGEVPWKGVA
jgi:hypothetical protein